MTQMHEVLPFLKSILTFERFKTAAAVYHDAMETVLQKLPRFGPGPRDWDDKDAASLALKPDKRRLARRRDFALLLSLALWAAILYAAFLLVRAILGF